MITIAIDAIVLMVLLKALNEDDAGFGRALLVALVAAIGTKALAVGLGLALGIAGIILAAIIAAAGLGIAVSALFGADIKRSCLIGAVFMIVHMGVSLGLLWLRS
jgi:hypothetical protein